MGGGDQPEWADLSKSQSPTQDLASFPPESVYMLLGQAWASWGLSATFQNAIPAQSEL